MALLIRKDAAEYLTKKSGVPFKPEGLAALATKGTGPAYSFVNGRAVYETEALDQWLAAQLAAKSPAARNRPQPVYPAQAA
jgi:hypothetical protein